MNTTVSRRDFLGGAFATAALAGCRCPLCGPRWSAKVAVQLYSIEAYIKRVGISQTLKEVAAIG